MDFMKKLLRFGPRDQERQTAATVLSSDFMFIYISDQLWLEKNAQSIHQQLPGIYVFVRDSGLSASGVAVLIGPPDTPYEGGCFVVSFRFDHVVTAAIPLQRVHDPPILRTKFQFITNMYHCNISAAGELCSKSTSEVNSQMDIHNYLQHLQCELYPPNLEFPIHADRARQFKDEPEVYNQTVRSWVHKYATRDHALRIIQEQFPYALENMANISVEHAFLGCLPKFTLPFPFDLKLEKDFQLAPSLPLGHGSYGVVFKAKCELLFQVDDAQFNQHSDAAFKQLHKLRTQHDIKAFEDEVYFLKILQHPNILTVFGVCREPHGLLTELLDCNLSKIIGDASFSPDKMLSCAIGCARGLAYLHSKITAENDPHSVVKHRVLHRDIKADNVLVSEDLSKIKLADFGLSRTICSMESARTNVGTPCMKAPEVLLAMQQDEDGYHCPADVFSYGMLLYEIVTGKMPYVDEADLQRRSAIQDAILSKRRPTDEFIRQPDHPTVKTLVECMKKCWNHDPQQRPTADDIVTCLEATLVSLNKPSQTSVSSQFKSSSSQSSAQATLDQ